MTQAAVADFIASAYCTWDEPPLYVMLVGDASYDYKNYFGLPGDTSIDVPYLYVTPWPYPEDKSGFPALEAGGRWQTEGWFGAVLSADALSAEGPDAQAAQMRLFVDAAVAASRRLLGAS